jgi:hypothetical protein
MGPSENVLPISDRKLDRLIRALGLDLQQGDLAAFENKVRASASPSLLLAARNQKILTRGDSQTRSGAAKILIEYAEKFLGSAHASEFARYAALCIEVSAARERLKLKVDKLTHTLPRLSMRQLLHVADGIFRRLVEHAESEFPSHDPEESVAENERRLHARSGYANDVSSRWSEP